MLIYKNKKNDKLYAFIEFSDDNANRYLGLEDKYVYTIPDEDMKLWCFDKEIDFLRK